MDQITGLLVPFIAMGAIMYFLLWRPEQAKQPRGKGSNLAEFCRFSQEGWRTRRR